MTLQTRLPSRAAQVDSRKLTSHPGSRGGAFLMVRCSYMEPRDNVFRVPSYYQHWEDMWT